MYKYEHLHTPSEPVDPVIKQMEHFTGFVIEPAMGELADSKLRRFALETFIDTLTDEPDTLFLFNIPYSQYSSAFRHDEKLHLAIEGLSELGQWHQTRWMDIRHKRTTYNQLIKKTTDRFAHVRRLRGGEAVPNWEDLQAAHNAYILGGNSPENPEYTRIYNGVQNSAILLCLERNANPQIVLNSELLV